MVVHLCCSVDAAYFLKRLKEDFPNEKLIGYFYDPNIHPYSEFKLRSLDTERICDKLGVEYIEGEYDFLEWYEKTKNLQNEPEKGKRCSVCFDFSLEKTAQFAKKIGDKKITTSLLMSPMKSHEQLKKVGEVIKRKYDIDFLNVDYRKKGGTQEQQEFAKKHQLYRQDYCGCLYGIWQQKKDLEIIDELISPYPFQILPSSIEEKLKFYKERIDLEEKGVKYKIFKENFLNYRLLRAFVKVNKKVVPSYTLFYSHLQKPQRVKIEFEKDEVGYTNRAGIVFVKLSRINKILNKNYYNVSDLYTHPLLLEEELLIRKILLDSEYSLSPLIVLEKFDDVRYDVFINSKIYADNKEFLIKF